MIDERGRFVLPEIKRVFIALDLPFESWFRAPKQSETRLSQVFFILFLLSLDLKSCNFIIIGTELFVMHF